MITTMFLQECGHMLNQKKLTTVKLHRSNIILKCLLTQRIKLKYSITICISIYISTIPVLDHNIFPSISPLTIHKEGVNNLLSNLKEHKAKGPDKIPTVLLKMLFVELSPA